MTTPNPPMPADPNQETDAPLPEHDPLDQPLRDLLDEWWAPPADLIGQLPGRGGSPPLDYLNHAYVTRALIECDPCWSWEPMSYAEDGQPCFVLDKQGNPQALWIWVTVHGVRRPGFGACDRPGTPDSVKSIISDALTNAGMRFGIALSLWTGKHGTDAGQGSSPKRTRKAPQKPAEDAGGGEAYSVKEAGKEAYDRLRDEFGKETVDGALATFNIARFSEITPAKEKVLRASLKTRSALTDATAMIQEQFGASDGGE
jgi:hypothetical protein